jgi:hypothetical protein
MIVGLFSGRVRGIFGTGVGAGRSFSGTSRTDTGIVSGSLTLREGAELAMKKMTKCSTTEAVKKRR